MMMCVIMHNDLKTNSGDASAVSIIILHSFSSLCINSFMFFLQYVFAS